MDVIEHDGKMLIYFATRDPSMKVQMLVVAGADRLPVFPLLMFLAADRAGLTYRQFATDGSALAAAQLKSYEPDDMVHCGAKLFNADPAADFLRATSQHCHDRAADCIRQAQGTRLMLSAGCELPADVPDEVLHAFCAAAVEAGKTV